MKAPNRMPRFPARLALASLLLLALGACGFQLRGEHRLAPELARINVAAPIEIERQLRRDLAAMGVEVSPRNQSSPEAFSLRVSTLESNSRTASFDANVDSTEIEVLQKMHVQLVAPGGATVMGQTISAERTYVHDRERLLGDEGERDVLRGEMEVEIAQRIIRQLRALSSEQLRSRMKDRS